MTTPESPRTDKIQTGLRIPDKLYEEIKSIADRAGISVNAATLFLVETGLRAVNLGVEEASRSGLHTPRDNGGE